MHHSVSVTLTVFSKLTMKRRKLDRDGIYIQRYTTVIVGSSRIKSNGTIRVVDLQIRASSNQVTLGWQREYYTIPPM